MLPDSSLRVANMGIKENVAHVRERIAAACRRSGRRPEDVKLVAISKTFPPESIRAAYEAGLRDFGENRVQEAHAKRPALSDLSITWHLVGHLQTNKAKAARELFHWVHSVDSFRLAQKLDQAAISGSGRLPVLLEVNLGGEESKAGAGESEIIQARRAGQSACNARSSWPDGHPAVPRRPRAGAALFPAAPGTGSGD